MIDLVLPNGKIIKQKEEPIRRYAMNDYDANEGPRSHDRWWEKTPLTVCNIMSAAPNQSYVRSEKW